MSSMKVYEFSGKASAFDNVMISFCSITYNSDGTFSARISASTLKTALSFLVRQLGDKLTSIHPLYYVTNNTGKIHLRWFKRSAFTSSLPFEGRLA